LKILRYSVPVLGIVLFLFVGCLFITGLVMILGAVLARKKD
jgi:hypothetical protein